MKTVIIDDERLARAELRALLADFPRVEVCGEAANMSEGLALVQRMKPDLVFLDIEMPGGNGFDFLTALPAPHPEIIFVTAFDAFAVRAFEVNALDYLLKPLHLKRLGAALERVREKLDRPPGSVAAEPTETPASTAPLRESDSVFVRSGERCWFVPIRSLSLLEAEGDHTRLHFDGQTPLLYGSLSSMEARLPSSLFLRANRSQLINLSFVETITPWFSGSLKVKLRLGAEVEFSRRQAQLFRAKLSL